MKLSLAEWVGASALGIGLAAFIGETFYGGWGYGTGFLVFLPAVFRIWGKEKEKREKKKRLIQLLDGMSAFADGLKAGYAAENAVTQSRQEMEVLYGNNSYISAQLRELERRLSTNQSLEEGFRKLFSDCGLKEGKQFQDIIAIVKENGGDMGETVRQGVKLSREKIRLTEELEALLSGKRFEGKVMKIMPLAVIWLLRTSSPEFLEPLYHTAFGRLCMTACLLLYAGAWLWEERVFRTCS